MSPRATAARRHLRHRRRPLAHVQHLDGRRARIAGRRRAGGQARQPRRVVAVRLGRPARGARRRDRPRPGRRGPLHRRGRHRVLLRAAVPRRDAVRRAGARELGVPTTFNFLGPLANPARVTRQVVGVSDPAMADRVIGTLAELGAEHALVFFGHDGLDELTTTTSRRSASSGRERDVTRARSARPRVSRRRARRARRRRRRGERRSSARARRAGGTGPRHRGAERRGRARGRRNRRRSRDGLEHAFASIDDGRAAAALEALVRTSVAAQDEGG